MNRHKILLSLLTALIIYPVQAEVFKCQVAEQKTIYQSTPCPASTVNQQVIEIEKPDPAKDAEAQARLNAWQADLAAKENANRQARKEQQEALDRQATIDALNRSAAAQEALAESAKQPVIINQPVVVTPYIRPHQPHGTRPKQTHRR